MLALPLLVLPPWFFPPDWGKTIVFRSILAIILCLVAWQLIYKKNEIVIPNIKKNKIIWLLLGLFFAFLLATIFSADPYFSLWGSPYRAGGFITFAFYIVFAVLTFLLFKNRDWQRAWDFLIVIGILVSFVAIIQFYGLFNNIFLSALDRPTSTMGNPIMLAIYLLLLFFITLSFSIKEKRIVLKIFYIFSLLLFFYVILITGSRAAYLGLIMGVIYFLLFFPISLTSDSQKNFNVRKKINILKTAGIVFLIFGTFFIYYINTHTTLPPILQENKILQAIRPRISITLFLEDPRFSAWQVVTKEIKERPIWGFGPENLAIGFDKYYDPSLPFISKEWGGWWDRAHNIILDTAATSGIPAAIIYLALFIVLFWQLQKSKQSQQQLSKISDINESPITYHGIQATLIAYFTANFFSFDGFSSYLLFFLIIGYSLHLTRLANNEMRNNPRPIKRANIIMGILFILLVFFLWKYNFIPLQINAQIIRADNFADDKKCDQAFLAADRVLSKHSFLDAYMAIHYVETIQKCAKESPSKDLEYAKNGVELMKKAIKIRPLYSRLWIFLGSFTTVQANIEQDSIKKSTLIKEANTYFERANQLAPSHQEILVEQAKTDMIAGNYQAMKEKAEKCISLDSSLVECYWTKALSEIYLKDANQAKEDMQIAYDKRFDTTSVLSLHQLVGAYSSTENYQELSLVYLKLISLKPSVPEYHSSLAFTYAKMGEYKKARQEALIFLKLMPEAKEEVEAFLMTMPR